MNRRMAENEIVRVIAGNDELCQLHAVYMESGYKLTGGRSWLCRDRTITVRLVWRRRDNVASTVTCVMRGLPV